MSRYPSDRDARIPVRLTRAELAAIDAAARRDGKPRSTWIAEQALAAAEGGAITIPREVADAIREQARARGIPIDRMAAMIASAAIGWPAPDQ